MCAFLDKFRNNPTFVLPSDELIVLVDGIFVIMGVIVELGCKCNFCD